MTIRQALEKMESEIDQEYDLDLETAKYLFESIWHMMISDIGGIEASKAIDIIVNVTKIGMD